ncbi:hypothetical protein HDU96_001899 [Phlyctochytrium bullatum]|nr:hypothetical protein HDU96_001899 [Phlyctochytrium bullatum]
MSHSLSWAILSRAMCGFLNGNVGVAKCVMGEITDSTNQAKGFSIFGLMWGIGMICGPVLGGFLSNPTVVFPGVFGGCTFLEANPYFLPCLISAIISMIGFFIGFFYLEETSVKRGAYAPVPTDESIESKPAPSHEEDEEHEDIFDDNEIQRTVRVDPRDDTLRESVFTHVNEPSGSSSAGRDVEEAGAKAEREAAMTTSSFIGWNAVYAIFGYGLLSFQNIIFDETFSLWVVTPPGDGGLGFTSSDIGFCLSLMGCMTLFMQLIVYPYLSRFLSTLSLYRIAVCTYIAIFPMFPMISTFIATGPANVKMWTWPLLLVNMAGRHFCNVLGFTSVMIMINNSAAKGKLGIVNGVGQTTAAFVRSIATLTALQSRFIPEKMKEDDDSEEDNLDLCHEM